MPVAVVDEGDRLAGVIFKGSLIAGLTTSIEPSEEGGENYSGVGAREQSEIGGEGGQ